MTRNELQDHSGEGPIWGFVQQLATERWTGQADVGIDPRVELCVSEGRVYFAQKSDDPPLGPRLLGTGVITAEQLRRGAVHLGDTTSLARLFQREPDIDRDTVELMVQHLTDRLLEQVAEHPVGEVLLHPLRHHPSGIHQWFLESHPAPVPDTAAPMAVLRDVVATLSGEVPVVRDIVATPTTPAAPSAPSVPAAISAPPPTPPTVAPAPAPPSPFDAPVAPMVPSPSAPALDHSDPPRPTPSVPAAVIVTVTEEHTTGPILTEVPVAPALPRLGDLGLTPLPTLGTVGTRVPDPVAPVGFVPNVENVQGLPSLAADPITASVPIVRAAEEARAKQADNVRRDLPAAQLANAIAATDVRSRVPETLTLEGFMSPAALPRTAPLPASPAAAALPALPTVEPDCTATVSASPNTNPAGAPPESPAGEIWEMVDELLGLPHQEPATTASSSDRKGRGWLRKR